MRGTPKDARSTGRKRGRKVLETTGRPFQCEVCSLKPVPPLSRSNNLDVNHKNKNILDNDPANLEWLCRTCHRAKDRQTAKGIAHDDEYRKLYGELF